ncbi:MAG: efflux RND transporter periplasmic adaptor subunit [Candidatus Paceibacterota bacterium]
MQPLLAKIPNFLKSKWTIGIVILLILGVGGYFLFHKDPTYQYITVQNGSITQTVSLTGNTTPLQSVSLTFGNSGIVSNIYSDLGKQVNKGQVLAELNMNDLLAQLHSAEASLVIAQQNASVSKSNVTNVTAQQDILVQNAYRNLLNSTPEAVPHDSSSDYIAPVISGNYNLNKEGVIKVKFYYSSSGISFNISGLSNGSGSCNTILPQPLGDSGLYIKCSSSVINIYDWDIEIPNKKASDYLTNYNAYQLALETRNKAIADAQASVGTIDSSSVVDAQVAQAQASVDSAKAKILNAQIVAPISGTVTQFDAKVGQLASSSVPLVSIISNSGYEVDAGVSETDIGKISIGDKVSMTLDAFPNETFTGSVFYIAPADTNVQGVISFKIKISFDQPDPRLKSGLTANLDIETERKDNVLILPQYAILQNDEGAFIQTLENNVIKENPVTLGIQDKEGNVEIISGVSEGEQVLNIGLKAQ